VCTLIALHRCYPSAHLLVAANRDEFLARPASGLRLHEWSGRRVIAPLDERAGGTWLGLNDAGLFAALTNRPTQSLDPARRSRGLLVADALGHPSAARAAEAALQLSPRAYNPFNLFVADAEHAFAIMYDEKPRMRVLEPGVHVIGNADPDDADVPKIARLLADVERVAGGPAADALDALGALCRSHDARSENPLERTCIHAGEYGTRSSTLLRLGNAREQDVLRFAGGAPCETPYEDSSQLLRALD
jgi:uncharacterized protein with NRDE domain